MGCRINLPGYVLNYRGVNACVSMDGCSTTQTCKSTGLNRKQAQSFANSPEVEQAMSESFSWSLVSLWCNGCPGDIPHAKWEQGHLGRGNKAP